MIHLNAEVNSLHHRDCLRQPHRSLGSLGVCWFRFFKVLWCCRLGKPIFSPRKSVLSASCGFHSNCVNREKIAFLWPFCFCCYGQRQALLFRSPHFIEFLVLLSYKRGYRIRSRESCLEWCGGHLLSARSCIRELGYVGNKYITAVREIIRWKCTLIGFELHFSRKT
jgi:hypothetical protein